mmetsp:Transcript_60867/g.162942  ORF Transcript_60867/g.162942 Transcript_60867/m.162942 type:complete len:446 (-) Transcript_60867:96-1433(-)
MALVWSARAASLGGGSAAAPPSAPEGAPLSARQRKQVYMHSAIFEASGAPQESVYTASRQHAVMGEVNRALRTPRREHEAVLPKPADMKATANFGHGVVIWNGSAVSSTSAVAGAGGGPQDFVNFGETAEPMPVVHANRDDRGMPREFRGTSTSLQWSDTRAERVSCRGQGFFDARAGMDAGARKQQDLSSEIFGGRAPKTEARPASGVKIELPTGSERQEVKTPFSARERQSRNLNPSNESQFSVYEASPAPGHPGKEDAAPEARRRSERNYSDLFGKPTAGSSAISRTELHGTTNAHFLDFHVEIASRKMERRSPPPPKERVIYRPSASTERACWDTRSIMDSSSEIARRSREHAQQEGDRQARDRSASERKRVELGSGQLRLGTGAQPEPHDAARHAATPSPSQRTRRSLTDSPLATRSYRSMRPESARARKQLSLMGSGIF